MLLFLVGHIRYNFCKRWNGGIWIKYSYTLLFDFPLKTSGGPLRDIQIKSVQSLTQRWEERQCVEAHRHYSGHDACTARHASQQQGTDASF
jgi:hypothetical protein